ncbi:hypothetical protein [Amycolatopsis magusensis]|uniref:hypothetical protein n=1 Tax=Amycolatopsis magusensis TaxID=882444 RepID=UPI00378A1B4C
MGDKLESTVTISHWLDELTAPAAQAESFSGGEILARAAVLHEMRSTLTPDQQNAVLTQLPRGYAEGFEAFATRFRASQEQLAGNHQQRLHLLKRAQNLPYVAYEALLQHTTKTVFGASAASDLTTDWSPGAPPDIHAANLTKARTLLRLIKLLLVLSSAGRRSFPTALAPVLLFLLLEVLPAAKNPAGPESRKRKPDRALRPPGRSLRSKPRVARAPGYAAPLTVLHGEGHVRPCAFGGAP